MYFIISTLNKNFHFNLKKNTNYLRRLAVCFQHSVKNQIFLSDEIIAAKQRKLPIVALESAIITHGMPYPDNLDTVLEVEHIIRQKSVVPATIAILDGKIKVGVSKQEIEKLAKNKKKNFIKISRRDLAYAIVRNMSGGTTVSASMLIANLAGIPIMATGGIGGVHREVISSFDISADLKELGQTPVAVVCSGVKAILDIHKTLEYLESEGVPVVTVGSTLFPAFYSRHTSDRLQSPMTIYNTKEASHLIRVHRQLSLTTGILFSVPIPESFSLDPLEIENVIKKAEESAKSHNICGKRVTPFLLKEVSRLTNRRCLTSNKALIKHNVDVAAEIALHFSESEKDISSTHHNNPNTSTTKWNPVIIGGATVDTLLKIEEIVIKFNGSTHKAERSESCGGVGRNVAAALINLGMKQTKFLSIVGDDEFGKLVTHSVGNAASTIQVLENCNTPRYTAIVDTEGNCCFGISEMKGFLQINKHFLQQNVNLLKNTKFLVLDGNLSIESMKYALDIAIKHKIKVWYEPTDLHKAIKIFQCNAKWQEVLYFISPNVNELLAIAKYFQIATSVYAGISYESIKIITEQICQHIPVVIATLGEKGVLITRKSPGNEPFLDPSYKLIENSKIQSRLYQCLTTNKQIANVSGCGDCLAAGIITGIIRGWKETHCVNLGLYASRKSLTSFETVPNSLKLLPKFKDFYDLHV